MIRTLLEAGLLVVAIWLAMAGARRTVEASLQARSRKLLRGRPEWWR